MEANTSHKLLLKESFQDVKTIESIYTGGKVLITQDEQYLITTLNEDIIVSEISTGNQVKKLEGDTEIVTTMAVKPNGKHLVSASRGLQMRIWDLSTGECIRQLKAHDAPVIVMDIDPTSTLVATGGADAMIKVWDIDKGYCTHNLKGHGGVVSAIKFHNFEGKWYLATGADDCQIRIWDLQKRSCIGVLQSHVSVVRGLDFSQDGRILISGSRDRVVNVWDWQAKKLIATYPIYETLETVGFLPKGIVPNTDESQEVFYTGGDQGAIRLWNLKTGENILSQTRHEGSKQAIIDILFSPASKTLTAITNDQLILTYSVPQSLCRVKQIVGYNDEIIDIAYVGHDQYLAAATNSELLKVYNVDTQDCDLLYGHTDMIICLSSTRDGTLLATGSKDKTARIWKVDDQSTDPEQRFVCVGVCVGHAGMISAVAFGNKSKDFLITTSQDRTFKYWHMKDMLSSKTKTEFRPLTLYTHQGHEKDINTVAVAPNDKLFATGSQDKTAKVWNTDSGELVGVIKGHKRGVWCVRFSPVEQVLATSSGDKTVKIWSLSDFSCLKTFEGHTNSVLRVEFLTAGLQLASSGSDGLVKVWTIKTNECASTLDNHEDKVWALALNEDESRLVSAGADSVVTFWQDVTLEEQEKDLLEKEKLIIKEQELQVFLRKKDYLNAILLAMSLEQPFRLLTLFRNVIESRPETDKESITGAPAVDKVLAELDKEHIAKLLGYIRDWNTNAKHAEAAQIVLHAVVSSHPAEDVVSLPAAKELLEGLLPYTDRHFRRLDDLITQSYILDYTLHAQE